MVVNQLSVGYDEDFNRWIEQTIALLKARRFEELDIDNLIDELESRGKRDLSCTGVGTSLSIGTAECSDRNRIDDRIFARGVPVYDRPHSR